MRPLRAASRAVERGSAVLARQDVDQLGAVRPAGLPRKLREKAEDGLASVVQAGHDPVPGNGPDGVLGEEATQREPLLPRERVEDPADDRLVVSCRHGRPPSA